MQESSDIFDSQANSLQANKMCSCDTEDTIVDFIFTVERPLTATSTIVTFFCPGGDLGIFWVGMCRLGLQIGTPF